MGRILREIYSIIEMIFSKTGSFGPARTIDRPPPRTLVRAADTARDTNINIFIGIVGPEALEERMAAD